MDHSMAGNEPPSYSALYDALDSSLSFQGMGVGISNKACIGLGLG
jgi:hypothetical protein